MLYFVFFRLRFKSISLSLSYTHTHTHTHTHTVPVRNPKYKILVKTHKTQRHPYLAEFLEYVVHFG